MKTTIKFEPSDFKGGGQLIIRNSSPRGSTDISFALSVSYKIGYISTEPGPKKLTKVSLNDGWTQVFESDKALCDALNKDAHGYRPMNKREIERILTYEGNRFTE
jgi:hypothetical protein